MIKNRDFFKERRNLRLEGRSVSEIATIVRS